MHAADFEPTPNRCAFGLAVCDPNHPCPLHEAWTELNDAFVSWAEKTTIADTQALSAAAESGLAGLLETESNAKS